MLDVTVCWTSLYARRHYMLDVAVHYAGHHCTLDVAICWISLYAGCRSMLDITVRWMSLYAGISYMLDVDVCWTSLDVAACWTSLYAKVPICRTSLPNSSSSMVLMRMSFLFLNRR